MTISDKMRAYQEGYARGLQENQCDVLEDAIKRIGAIEHPPSIYGSEPWYHGKQSAIKELDAMFNEVLYRKDWGQDSNAMRKEIHAALAILDSGSITARGIEAAVEILRKAVRE